jgi:predicted RNA-binding protein
LISDIDGILNYWIFVVSDRWKYNLKAEDIFRIETDKGFWGLGRNAPHRAKVRKGDRVIFAAGSRLFLGSAELASDPLPFSPEVKETMAQNDVLREADYRVALSDVWIFPTPLPVEKFVKDLSFIQRKDNYRFAFRGGIRKLVPEEYDLIVSNEESDDFYFWERAHRDSQKQKTLKQISLGFDYFAKRLEIAGFPNATAHVFPFDTQSASLTFGEISSPQELTSPLRFFSITMQFDDVTSQGEILGAVFQFATWLGSEKRVFDQSIYPENIFPYAYVIHRQLPTNISANQISLFLEIIYLHELKSKFEYLPSIEGATV